MVFNSWLFFFFFAIVLALYAVMRRPAQNAMLLVASCFFYGWWDWRFLFLVGFSTVVDYWTAIKIEDAREERVRRRFLMASLVSNLAILGFFKYFNFFAESFHAMLQTLGVHTESWVLEIILPVGISFYTFHALSYTIDVYRRDLKATRSFRDFALFVMFFPQLVAGPIGRASHQLPQFLRDRHVTYEGLSEGLWLILYGLFKKVCVADNLAPFVEQNFARSAELTGPTAYLTVVLFTYQIYCDFSGYTDIARGSAKMMGFDILPNFRRPFAATDPQDFWQRWHISLSRWLRDYLFTSLGGARYGTWFTYRNLLITMALGGLWHGAAWNFVWWGIYQGAMLVGFQMWSQWRERQKLTWLTMPKTLAIAVMFQFTLFGFLLFRATRRVLIDGVWVDQGLHQVSEFLSAPARGMMWTADASTLLAAAALYILPLLVLEFFLNADREDRGFLDRSSWVPVAVHATVLFFIFRYGVQNASTFIYFQF
jgi:D-alanyl-lipoteichoic acid acyltransferase DltB (MBOAT superfamily)